ncbi:MAG TPA: hypothetical protein VGO60_05895, partial [Iamia sp.]|nr:hypothetical protein [Iamia sp.]
METTAPTPTAPTRRRWRRYTLWALALVIAGVGGLATYALAAGPPKGTLDWDWSLAERYGRDADGDGIVDNPDGVKDLAADKRWIQEGVNTLTIDTCDSRAVTERQGLTFELTLTGPQYPTGKTFSGSSCKITQPLTKLGAYTANVDIKMGPLVVDSRSKPIEPKDLLVVSVGDSVASGEGNPDRLDPSDWLAPKWQNAQCHRTSLAGPAQAALRLERRDPHTSITFVHVACSGASITEGLLGAYDGQDPSKGTRLAPQLDQVRDLVGTRPIDAVTVSVGANDAKFS